jgi:hypothetical protein
LYSRQRPGGPPPATAKSEPEKISDVIKTVRGHILI